MSFWGVEEKRLVHLLDSEEKGLSFSSGRVSGRTKLGQVLTFLQWCQALYWECGCLYFELFIGRGRVLRSRK